MRHPVVRAAALSCLVAGILTPAGLAAEVSCGDGLPEPRRTLRVSTLGELAERLAAAQPGDRIVVANGTYSLAGPLRLRQSGSEGAPIVLAAETVSGVELAGEGGLHLAQVSHVVVCGFRFTHKPWDAIPLPLEVRGVPGADDEIAFFLGTLLDGSHHVRVTRNTFALADQTFNSFWLLVSGGGSGHNRIDHNRFEGKKSRNSFLAVYGPSGGMSQQDQVDHNYFYRHLYPLEGGEAVRYGNGGRAPWGAHGVFEYNLFEECNGDPEALSIKSSESVYRYNTIRHSHGGIVLRHGDRNVVEGNFIVDNEGGIRIYGDEHRVIDNYISGNVGTVGLGSMVLLSGGTEDDTGSGQCQNRPTGVLIAHNTLVNNQFSHLEIGSTLPLPPRRCRIEHNIIQGDSGVLFRMNREPEESSWTGNILWGRAATGDTSLGYERRDPQLTKDAHGIYRPRAEDTSRSGDAAGLGVGARHPGGALGRPLTPADVGPLAP